MMTAITTRPMTMPASRSAPPRLSTTPRIVNSRIPVPIASISIAEPSAVSGAYATCPTPASFTLCANTPQMARAPTRAPAHWATTYGSAWLHGIRRVQAIDSVTAGLMWQPETLPMAYTIPTTARPKAVEIVNSSAPVKGAPPVPPRTRNSAGTEPAPRNTRTAVPSASAPSFCANEFSSIRSAPPPDSPPYERRPCRLKFDNVERRSRHYSFAWRVSRVAVEAAAADLDRSSHVRGADHSDGMELLEAMAGTPSPGRCRPSIGRRRRRDLRGERRTFAGQIQ